MPLPTAPGRTGQTAVAPRRIPSDLIHFVLWALAVALLAGMLQGLAWLIGWRLDIRDEGGAGRGILLALAAGGVFSVIAAERRSPAEYGLLIDDRWARQLLGGCAVGMLVYAGYCFLAVYLGALSSSGPVKPGRWVSAALTALLAFVIAPLQEIVFRGYLLGLAKNRLSTPAAVVLVSCLFALSLQFHTNPSMLAVENRPLLTGMFLAGILFALMRLHHGSVMAPIGLLSGWLFVEILIRRTHLIATINDPLLAHWLCPHKDPRRAPVLWLILAVAILGYSLLLHRSPTIRSSETVTSVSLSFKKFFPFSNLGMMAPLDLWLTRLWHARFAVGWIYVPRLLAILSYFGPEHAALPAGTSAFALAAFPTSRAGPGFHPRGASLRHHPPPQSAGSGPAVRHSQKPTRS